MSDEDELDARDADTAGWVDQFLARVLYVDPRSVAW